MGPGKWVRVSSYSTSMYHPPPLPLPLPLPIPLPIPMPIPIPCRDHRGGKRRRPAAAAVRVATSGFEGVEGDVVGCTTRGSVGRGSAWAGAEARRGGGEEGGGEEGGEESGESEALT